MSVYQIVRHLKNKNIYLKFTNRRGPRAPSECRQLETRTRPRMRPRIRCAPTGSVPLSDQRRAPPPRWRCATRDEPRQERARANAARTQQLKAEVARAHHRARVHRERPPQARLEVRLEARRAARRVVERLAVAAEATQTRAMSKTGYKSVRPFPPSCDRSNVKTKTSRANETQKYPIFCLHSRRLMERGKNATRKRHQANSNDERDCADVTCRTQSETRASPRVAA